MQIFAPTRSPVAPPEMIDIQFTATLYFSYAPTNTLSAADKKSIVQATAAVTRVDESAVKFLSFEAQVMQAAAKKMQSKGSLRDRTRFLVESSAASYYAITADVAVIISITKEDSATSYRMATMGFSDPRKFAMALLQAAAINQALTLLSSQFDGVETSATFSLAPTDDDSSDPGLTIGAKIGIAIGIIVLAILIGVGIFFYCRKRQSTVVHAIAEVEVVKQ